MYILNQQEVKIMRRNKVEYTHCPQCGAICLTGNDDDFQVFCAKCGRTFISKENHLIEREEFGHLIVNRQIYQHGGWTCFDNNVDK